MNFSVFHAKSHVFNAIFFFFFQYSTNSVLSHGDTVIRIKSQQNNSTESCSEYNENGTGYNLVHGREIGFETVC